MPNMGHALFAGQDTQYRAPILGYYQQAIRYGTRDAAVYTNMGHILFAGQRYSEALEYYQQVISSGTKDTAIHRRKGDALLALCQYPEALTAYKAAHRLDYHHKGFVYTCVHKRETLAAYWREIQQDLNDTNVDQENDQVSYKSFTKALINLWRVIRLAPDDAYAYKIKSLALRHLGYENEALAAYMHSTQLSSR